MAALTLLLTSILQNFEDFCFFSLAAENVLMSSTDFFGAINEPTISSNQEQSTAQETVDRVKLVVLTIAVWMVYMLSYGRSLRSLQQSLSSCNDAKFLFNSNKHSIFSRDGWEN
jgi:hypothetical protein